MKNIKTGSRYLLILLICLLCLFPFVILVIISLNTPQANMYEGNVLIPDFYFGNYAEGWAKSHIGRAMINSGIITFFALALIVLLGAMAGYAVARFTNKFNKSVFSIMLCCMMIPGIINTVPLYTLMIRLNAINTLWGMACVCATLALPQSVFIFSGFIRAVPKELEEAAKIDGCNSIKTLWYVIVPMLKPSLVSCALFQFMWTSNDFMGPLIYISDMDKYTNSIYLRMSMDGDVGFQWNRILAMSLISILPSLIVFFCAQDSFIDGIAAGGVKG